MALTAEDVKRLDVLFAKYPGRSDVDRDEVNIAKILRTAERRASNERLLLFSSYHQAT